MKTYESGLLWKKIIKIAGITAGVYVSVRFLLPLVIPFLAAFGLAALLNGLAKKILRENCRYEKALRTVLFFCVLAVVAAVGIFLAYELVMQIKELCLNYGSLCGKLKGYWGECCGRLEALSGVRAGKINEIVCEKAAGLWKKGQDKVMAGIWNHSVNGVQSCLHILWVMLVISVSTLLIFLDYDHLFLVLKESGIGKTAGHIANRVKTAGGSYLKAQLIIWLCVSTICVVGLFLTGNSYALLAGIAIGFCDALPFLGTGTVFIPWMILEVLQGKYGLAIWYLVIYLCCSITREMLEPKLVGKGIGVHPICVLMSIYIGIKVYGGVGVLFGPLSAFLIWEIYKMTEIRQEEEKDTESKNPR